MVELLLMAVDPLQDSCDQQELEGAAHRKALIRAIARSFASSGVEHGYAQPASIVLLQLFQSGGESVHALRGGMKISGDTESGEHEKAAAVEHWSSRTRCLRSPFHILVP